MKTRGFERRLWRRSYLIYRGWRIVARQLASFGQHPLLELTLFPLFGVDCTKGGQLRSRQECLRLVENEAAIHGV
jgi:hypothetical protein